MTFSDKATVWLNDEEVRASHLSSAHADGDAVIWFVSSNVVHIGDGFVSYGFPSVDVANGGSVSGPAAGCEQALGLVPPDARSIPGHRPISTASDIRAFVQMVKGTRAAVEAAVRQVQRSSRSRAGRTHEMGQSRQGLHQDGPVDRDPLRRHHEEDRRWRGVPRSRPPG